MNPKLETAATKILEACKLIAAVKEPTQQKSLSHIRSELSKLAIQTLMEHSEEITTKK